MIYLLALASISPQFAIVDRYEYIETNHLYDSSDGDILLDQYIFWDGDRCQGWMMVKDARVKFDDLDTDEERAEYERAAKAFQADFIAKAKKRFVAKWLARGRRLPQIERNWDPPEPPKYSPPFLGKMPRHVNGGVELIVHKEGRLRRIIADFAVETWTTIDPELENREYFKRDERRGLTNTIKVPK